MCILEPHRNLSIMFEDIFFAMKNKFMKYMFVSCKKIFYLQQFKYHVQNTKQNIYHLSLLAKIIYSSPLHLFSLFGVGFIRLEESVKYR